MRCPGSSSLRLRGNSRAPPQHSQVGLLGNQVPDAREAPPNHMAETGPEKKNQQLKTSQRRLFTSFWAGTVVVIPVPVQCRGGL